MFKVFMHCGDVGDVIYSLHTMKLLDDEKYKNILTLRNYYPVREAFTKEKVAKLTPFFESQFYVDKVAYDRINGIRWMGPSIKLDKWRDGGSIMRMWGIEYNNIAAITAYSLGIQNYPQEESWLICPDPKKVAEIVVSRSSRCHNQSVNWNKVLYNIYSPKITDMHIPSYNKKGKSRIPKARHFIKDNLNFKLKININKDNFDIESFDVYRKNMIFVGYPEEYNDFCNKFGEIKYYPTETFYELFQVIAGCKIFCGNQSAPMALAIGLGVPKIIQEVWSYSMDCKFNRGNMVYLE